jgi:hypothetical protein
VAKDYGVRAGQYRKSYLSILLVLDRRVSESGRYGGYRWVAPTDRTLLELVSERDLSAMAQIDPEAYFGRRPYPPFRGHTYERAERAAKEDRERWGLKPL